MSEEHYPARCTGNDDIVALDIVKMIDTLQAGELQKRVQAGCRFGTDARKIAEDYFDQELASSLYPKGRTARTLCRNCNTFLGKYDSAYLRFYNADGSPKIIKGFQEQTKYQIIKAIYAKFLSIPEAAQEKFDFLDFLRDEKATEYNGKWHIYFVKRDFSSDLLGLKDIGTGVATFDEGVVYELSDEKFIFNLMDFEKHKCYEMNNIFDILDKQYTLITGVGEHGGYHASIFLERMFSSFNLPDKIE